MQLKELHPWNVKPEEAIIYQKKLRLKISFTPTFNHIKFKKAIEITLSCTTKFRIPVPVRETHLFVNKIRKNLWT